MVKRIIFLISLLLFVLTITFSCGKKKAQETDKVPLEVKKAELMDSTRLDSAKVDTFSVKSTE
ncbi:MAG: hypothetical protein GXO93_08750 [FCB group bacterium]|nr:hypothetical protein [FCB group bacterium]